MLKLDKLESVTKKRKRVGRGGGRGGQSGRGHKGQRARSGCSGELKPFFEGGQMPLSRRLPRRGFTNVFKTNYHIINLQDLEYHFEDGDVVNKESLMGKRIIKGKKTFPIKVLGKGALTKKLTITVDAYSKVALQAIEKAQGKALFVKEIDSGIAS